MAANYGDDWQIELEAGNDDDDVAAGEEDDADLQADEAEPPLQARPAGDTKTDLASNPWFFMFLQSLDARATHPYSEVNNVVFWGVLGGGNPNIFRMPFRQNSNMCSWLSWLSFVEVRCTF